jgi:hypothetical protein
MHAFEAGFMAQAEEYGMASNEASRMYKRASDFPGTAQLFKTLPSDGGTGQPQQSPQLLGKLSDMLKQHLLDAQYAEETQRLPLK